MPGAKSVVISLLGRVSGTIREPRTEETREFGWPLERINNEIISRTNHKKAAEELIISGLNKRDDRNAPNGLAGFNVSALTNNTLSLSLRLKVQCNLQRKTCSKSLA